MYRLGSSRIHPFSCGAVLLFVVALSACSSSSSSSSGSTFTCGSNNCTSGSQYCLKAESAGTYSCVNLPSGCTTGQWCETCLASIPNKQSCAEATIGDQIDIEVDTN